MRPSRVVAGEILEYDGNFPARKIAAVSQFVVANGLLRQGKADQAVTHAEMAVALDPSSLYAHETLAFVYAANRRREDAMREYQAAVQVFGAVNPEFAKDVFPPPQNPLAAVHQ